MSDKKTKRGHTENPANRKVERTANRPTRRKLHRKNVIPQVEIPGFKTRLVNAEGTRINDYLAAGYSYVTREELAALGIEAESTAMGDDSLQKTKSEGSIIEVSVNRDVSSSAKRGILMKIPEEFYKEDFADKQKELDEAEATWNPQFNKKQGPGFYS